MFMYVAGNNGFSSEASVCITVNDDGDISLFYYNIEHMDIIIHKQRILKVSANFLLNGMIHKTRNEKI